MTERQAPTVRQALAELVAALDGMNQARNPGERESRGYVWASKVKAARSVLSAAAPDHAALIERLRDIAHGMNAVSNQATLREAAAALESGVPEQRLADEFREFDDDERQLLAYINDTPALLSLLYDLDLMPEQTLRNEDARAKTFCIADHWRVDRTTAVHPAEWVPTGELGDDDSDAADATRFRAIPKMTLAIIWRRPNPLLGDLKDGYDIESLRVWTDAAIKAALPPPPAADK